MEPPKDAVSFLNLRISLNQSLCVNCTKRRGTENAKSKKVKNNSKKKNSTENFLEFESMT